MFERAGPSSPVATSIKDAGIDAHKLQLMKASFFIDDDAENNSGKLSEAKFLLFFLIEICNSFRL